MISMWQFCKKKLVLNNKEVIANNSAGIVTSKTLSNCKPFSSIETILVNRHTIDVIR